MSESVIAGQLKNQPQPIYLKDYEVPSYFIDEINLDVDLHETCTIVKSSMKIRHNRLSPSKTHDLILNGEALKLKSIHLNGQSLNSEQYEVTDCFLILHNVPDQFDLVVVIEINPKKNTALSGLYCSRQTFCTQCEAEGFRRITYFLYRP